MNKDSYPKAIVPEFLVKRTIETMPLETAYYVDLGDEDDYYDPPAFCVMPDGALHCRLSAQLDEDDTEPGSILGRVGIMKIAIIHEGRFHEGLIADLRFLQEGQLLKADDTPPDDQEEFNGWLEAKNDLRPIVAFIAPADADDEVGIFYGDELYHPALQLLRERADALLEATMQQHSEKQTASSKIDAKAKKATKKLKTDDQ
jgi:hypothetical protein